MKRHEKLQKHQNLINQQNQTLNQQNLEQEATKSSQCDNCNADLIEDYRNCDCRKCEDWGGCKEISGYYFLKCPSCSNEYQKTKIIKWESDIRHGII